MSESISADLRGNLLDERSFKRNLKILWVCQFFVMAGMSSVVPFLPFFIRELGIRDFRSVGLWSGWIFAAPFFVSFFITPLWGSMADKYGRKLMTVRAITGLSISLVLIGLSQTVTQLLLFRILQGFLSGFYPAALALIAAQAPRGKISKSLASLQSANVAGNIFGPLFGGSLAAMVGYRMMFMFSAIITAIMAALLIMYVKDVAAEDSEATTGSFIENWKSVLHVKKLWIICLFMTIAALAEAYLRPIFVLFVESFPSAQHNAAIYSGILLSIHGFSAAVSALLFGGRVSEKKIFHGLFIAFFGTGIMNCLQAFIPDINFLFPVRIVLGLFYGLVFPLLFSVIAFETPMNRKSGIMGIASSFQTLGNFIGPLAAGYLLSLLHFKGSFLFSGFLFILMGTMVLTIVLRRQKSD